MYFLSNDERRLISARLLPEIRSAGVADELRGWNWSKAPLAPIYDGKLTVAEITAQGCSTARDLYLRHVLGQAQPSRAPSTGASLRAALRSVVTEAKLIIYEHGAACLPALSAFVDTQAVEVDLWHELTQFGVAASVPVPQYVMASTNHATATNGVVPGSGVEKAAAQMDVSVSRISMATTRSTIDSDAILHSQLKQFAARRILQATEGVLLANPKMGADALAASALPVIVDYNLDGSLLGLRKQQSVDMLQLGGLMPVLIRFGRRSAGQRLTTTGYALIGESLLERPIDIGCIVYVSMRNAQLTIERDIHIINDELRQEFIELRDERMRMVEEEIDPGVDVDCYDRCTAPGRCRQNTE